MASSVQVRNINPIGAVATVIDGESREVEAGEVITVSPEAAGKPARWRRVEVDADGAPTEPTDPAAEYREHAGHLEVRELGSGLLAQETNWEPVAGDDKKGDA